MMKTYLNIAAVLVVALLLGLAPQSGANAQGKVDYDTDDDGLIEITYLDQVNAIRWDLDGDGVADSPESDEAYDAALPLFVKEAYAAAFPNAMEDMGCGEGCGGYELMSGLDFKDASSYLSGEVNSAWVEEQGWLPISITGNPVERAEATADERFRAILEGNGYEIANLYINRPRTRTGLFGRGADDIAGLFGSSDGEIRNLSLTDVDIKGASFVGAIVGVNLGSLTGSNVTGSISADQAAGGLVGFNRSTVTSGYSTVNVDGKTYIGSLVGWNGAGGKITSSYATGDVSASLAGGLAGSNDGLISQSYATGGVSSQRRSGVVGGLVGLNDGGSIIACFATGDVSKFNRGYVGGLVGGIDGGTISSSYSTGSVSGDVLYMGGMVGGEVGTIKYSYTLSLVDDAESLYAGGFAGEYKSKVIASYWVRDRPTQLKSVGSGEADGIQGVTSDEMKEPTDYTGIYADWNSDGKDYWDFGTANEFPALRIAGPDGASPTQHGRTVSAPAPTPTPTPIIIETPTPSAPQRLPTATISTRALPTLPPPIILSPIPVVSSSTSEPETQKSRTEVLQTSRDASETAPADTASSGGCSSAPSVPLQAATVNLLLMLAPIGLAGGLRLRSRRRTCLATYLCRHLLKVIELTPLGVLIARQQDPGR